MIGEEKEVEPLGHDAGLILAYMMNMFLLLIPVAIAIWIGVDSRNNGNPWLKAIAWGFVALFFPIGPVIYLLVGRKKVELV